jgi:hypothetical protein
MKISEQSTVELIIRAKSQSGENLALIAERYQTLREVQWPVLRWYLNRLMTPDQVVNNSEMSVVFGNGSAVRCFSADRLNQMDGRFTDIQSLECIPDSELIELRETGIIPPTYVPATQPGIHPINGPPAVHHDPEEV